MTQQSYTNNKFTHVDDEIDLIELVKSIWQSRKKVLKITFLITFISLIYAFLTPVQYRSSATFYITSNDSSSGSALAGYAAILGVSTESNIDGMMASILNSDLIKEKVAMNYKEYFIEELTAALESNKDNIDDEVFFTSDFLIKKLKLEDNFSFKVDKNNLYKISYTNEKKTLTVKILNDYVESIFEFNETLELSNSKNIINIIDKPKIPLGKFKPKRKLVAIMGFIVGFLISLIYVLVLPFFKKIKEELKLL